MASVCCSLPTPFLFYSSCDLLYAPLALHLLLWDGAFRFSKVASTSRHTILYSRRQSAQIPCNKALLLIIGHIWTNLLTYLSERIWSGAGHSRSPKKAKKINVCAPKALVTGPLWVVDVPNQRARTCRLRFLGFKSLDRSDC